MICSLMYAAIGTRPDLAHTITILLQLSSTPNGIHLQAVRRTLRYLNGTMDWKLFYPKSNTTGMDLMCYSNASCGGSLGDRDNAPAMSYCSAVGWCSQKQRSVAVSTTEAEYMALFLTSQQLI